MKTVNVILVLILALLCACAEGETTSRDVCVNGRCCYCIETDYGDHVTSNCFCPDEDTAKDAFGTTEGIYYGDKGEL